MSIDLAYTTIVGNVTRDPEFRNAASGTPILKFGVAVNSSRKQNGEWVERASFYEVVAFGNFAERRAPMIHKGDRVVVTGSMERITYTKRDGTKGETVEIAADNIVPPARRTEATTPPRPDFADQTFDDDEIPF